MVVCLLTIRRYTIVILTIETSPWFIIISQSNTEVQILQIIANEYFQKICRFVLENLFLQIKISDI
jgi:hypothetical protein